MTKNPMRRLDELSARSSSSTLVWILSGLFAASCAAILVGFGWYWSFLSSYRAGEALPEQIALGKWLSIDTRWIEADQSALRGISALLVLMLLSLFLSSILFYAIARLATLVAVDRSQSHLRAIFKQLLALVRRRSPTLLQPVVHQLITQDVPAIREASTTWLRIGPRYLCLMAVHILVAILIDPLLAALALLAILLLRQLYVGFDKRRRRIRPVIYEQRQNELVKFAEWLGNGPLLATVDREQFGQAALDHHLATLRTHDKALDDYFGWKSPLTLGLVGLAALGVMFASAIQLMRTGSELSVIAILILYSSIVVVLFSFIRFRSAYSALQSVLPEMHSLISFLGQAAPEVPVDAKLKVPHTIRTIELQNVTLRSHTEEVTIEGLNVHLHAGEVVALVADNESAQSALSDLLLGFGYPSRGECLIEGVPLSKLGVDRLGELACWVAADGPLLTASVTDNLRTVKNSQVSSSDLTHILQRLKCDAAISSLPDGLATLISPNDDRLTADIPFRLGLARALSLQKPIVVVQEPTAIDDADVEADTRHALEQLAQQNVIVIVIPSRSKTLWMSNRVLFFQGGHLIAQGKHATLLEENDAYRHWNYMQFSPHLMSRRSKS